MTDNASGPAISGFSNGGDGNWAQSGNGGTVNIEVNGPVSSVSGTANGGPGSFGGKGGIVNIEINAAVGVGGVTGAALGGGSINPFPAGAPGTVTVTLNEGATVAAGGIISATAGGGAADELIFAFDLPSTAAYNDAVASIEAAKLLSGNANRTVTIDSNTYTFINFEILTNAMTVLRLPSGTVVPVVIKSPDGQSITVNVVVPGSAATPKYFRCDKRTLGAFLKDGSVTITAKLPDDGTKRFLVGSLDNEAFISGNPIGWTVTVEHVGRKTFARILDAAGALIGSCRI